MLARHLKGAPLGVYVTAAMRGTGVGRSIMGALLGHAARLERIEQVGLLVATTQVAAMRLYQSMGFVSFRCERWALKIGERYVDEAHGASPEVGREVTPIASSRRG